MKLDIWSETDVGLKRAHNEDSVLVDEDLGLFLVADGMGGHKAGDVASQLAVQIMQKEVGARMHENRRQLNPRVLLAESYLVANQTIFDYANNEGNKDLAGMGTTLVTAWLHRGSLYMGNVGDSRIYLFRDGHLWQLTEDHSLLAEQLRLGEIEEEDIPGFFQKNIITRSVGFEREVRVDLLERKIEAGDVYILCSDGLTGMVSDDKIETVCATVEPRRVVSQLVDLAKKGGGDDNISVVGIFSST